MPVIKDIRVYESQKVGSSIQVGKTGGQEDLYHFPYKKLAPCLLRLIFSLRHYGFQMDNSHLYIALTPALPDGEAYLADPVTGEFSWIRTVYLGTDPKVFNKKSEEQKIERLYSLATLMICKYFCTEKESQDILSISREVWLTGHEYQIVYKENDAALYHWQILVRILDSGIVSPMIRILKQDNTVLDTELSNMSLDVFVQQIGQVGASKRAVTIKPRNGAIAKHYQLEPIKIIVQE